MSPLQKMQLSLVGKDNLEVLICIQFNRFLNRFSMLSIICHFTKTWKS